MAVDYDHARDPATVEGSTAVLSRLFSATVPVSLLDVGCGTGTWMRAAIQLGVSNILGIDGVDVTGELLHVERTMIEHLDLSQPFDLGRRFDLALCLEVAEHLPESSSSALISSIVTHSDNIVFSAACPGQFGQHHVNCQWPVYWQRLFNSHGFACDDSIRWQIWDDKRIGPWYRQNIFWARRDPEKAGCEPRLKAVIHPEVHPGIVQTAIDEYCCGIQKGRMPVIWYVTTPARAAMAKLFRRINGCRGSLV